MVGVLYVILKNMKPYPILISALMLSFLSCVVAEPDRQLRAFLGITSVTSKVKLEAIAHYFEVIVFQEGKEIARLPTYMGFDPDPDHREIDVSLMFNDKGVVKFIGEGSVKDLSDDLDWSGVLKPTGGKSFHTGTSDKPIGLIEGFKVVGMVRLDPRNAGTAKFKTQPDLEMDESIRRSIENAKGCVLVVFKSGSQGEIEKAWSDSVNANKKKAE